MAEEVSNMHEHHPGHDHGHHGPAPQPTKTESTFADYKDTLIKVDIPAGYNALKTSFIDDRSGRATRRNKRCFLMKAGETVRFYQRINDHITVFAKQEADEIKANVTDYTALSAALGTKIADALTAISAAKAKIVVLKDKAVKMDEARKNSALSDAVGQLEKGYAPEGPKGAFGRAIEGVKNSAENCLNTADDAVEVAVKVTGIRAGSNVEILGAKGNVLADKIGAIYSDVVTNITDASGRQTAAQSEYNAALTKLSVNKYGKYDKALAYAAVLDTTSEIHQLDCLGRDRNWIKTELERLSRAIECNFIETNPPSLSPAPPPAPAPTTPAASATPSTPTTPTTPPAPTA